MVNLVTFLLAALCFFCQTSHGEDYSSCGVRSVHRGKIFGGLLSRPGMWPWQVAIFRKIRDERRRPRFLCGGALLNSRWVLSAAHCFRKRPHEENTDYSYTVKAGEYEIDIKDPHEQERNAFRIHNHPNFVPSTYENDIALIELDKGVKMGPHVRSICLPKANEILTTSGEVVSVAGWGFTTKGSYSSVLLYSAFEIQTNMKCADTTRYLYNETVMFCAGQSKGGNDNCKGESGGSSTVRQVLRDGRRRWVTVGMVSWGEGCGIKGKYGYYTRMEPFVPWIQDKINGSSLSCGNPGSIRNGRIIGSEFLVGFTVKYICNEGYRMRGRSTRRCRRNGKWTKAPTCLKVECRNPGTPRYGVRRPRRKKYYYKDKIRFRCKTNYTIVGRSAMRCRSDGTWSGFKPVCLAPCKDPGIPAGGIRLDHCFKHGQAVRFLCRKRNQPPSVSLLTCTNGKWNQNIPRCIDYSPCGESDYDSRGRMVGGNRASRGRWPWQVGLHRVDTDDKLKVFCGGALIDKRWVLTAASCFGYYSMAEMWTIKVGDYDLNEKDPSEQEFQVEEFFTHPNYNLKNYDNDIALVKLPSKKQSKKEVKLGPFVRTVCLPKQNEELLQPGNVGFVAGWGATQVLHLGQDPSRGNRRSKILLQSAFRVQNNTICGAKTRFKFNSNVTFCAGNGKGGNDTCQGDSGGSFVRPVLRDGKFKWVTGGLVSWGEGCGQVGKYGYYTRVAPFANWIQTTMKENEKKKRD